MDMMRDRLAGLRQDIQAKAPVKMVLSATLVAMSFAMSSPAFRANPIIEKVLGTAGHDMDKILPESLEKVTKALEGVS